MKVLSAESVSVSEELVLASGEISPFIIMGVIAAVVVLSAVLVILIKRK